MEKYKKLLKRLDPALGERLILAIGKIAESRLSGLDVKKSHHEIPVYRCRVGRLRILFEKTENGNWILSIKFRGDAY